MVFQSLLGAFLQSLRPRGDDDFVDRMNYFYTPTLLIAAAVITSLNQYVQQPLQCWLPEGWNHNMEQYIESYCWVQNTYFMPINEHIPDEYSSREERQIPYYQWVPFILVMQACMFTCPCILWRLLNWQTGVNVTQLIHSAQDVINSDSSQRAKGVRIAGRCLQDVLDLQAGLALQAQHRRHGLGKPVRYGSNEDGNGCIREDSPNSDQHHIHNQQPRWMLRYNGRCLTLLYLLIKMSYVVNLVLQLFMCNILLQGSLLPIYGYLVLRDLYYGRHWGISGHFPRVTLCDFEVFIFFWLWLALLFAITVSSFVFWVFQMLLRSQRKDFIIRYLYVCAANTHRSVSQADRALFLAPAASYDHFIDEYIRCDGNFILRVLSNHVGDVITMEIIRHLWRDEATDCSPTPAAANAH